MRKVTEQAVKAFMNGENFKSGNTEVRVGGGGNTVALRLHGNMIALRFAGQAGKIMVGTCGFNTTTTKERLNGLPGVSVYTSKHQLYLNDEEWDGTPAEVKVPE